MGNSIKQPTQSRGISTKNSIINASFKSLLKNGYKNTTTIKIAKELNISVGIIYSYFKNKDDLLKLWLNSLLEKCDDYFYNQFKLKDYGVELNLIIGNILEKISDSFFISPIVEEEKPLKIEKLLSSFYLKAERLFIKACNDVDIFIRHQNESIHIIFNLVKAYNHDLKNKNFSFNREALKNEYIKAIIAVIV